MPFVMRTWMYASGVMFPIGIYLEDQPQWISDLLLWNPVAIYMDLIRFALIDDYGSSNLPPHVGLRGGLGRGDRHRWLRVLLEV